ncbi:histone-lysine N-methyltransferase SETMAR [Trichonephila clavata]|uniref:Histone-lysine N-methyltransferase SETMAR n=1 Tax=Trichonephila clavata TaxID=2740835 RepID=A0A8X6KTV9_TRICU|nr:histone-lysine N-methyltransferase SETMAR [Trichonephila clavata]
MEVNEEKIRYILQFFFDKGEIENQTEIVNGVYDLDTLTANYIQFWFRQFRSGMPVVENVDKITEMIEVKRHVNSRSIAQELKIEFPSAKPWPNGMKSIDFSNEW